MAATTSPRAASASATASICVRPPLMPWWNTTSGAHLRALSGGVAPQGAATFSGLGTAMSAGISFRFAANSAAPQLATAGLSAPVVASSTSSVATFAETNRATLVKRSAGRL